MSKSRRYEILLPLKFNDGQPVPDSLIRATLLEFLPQSRGLAVTTGPGPAGVNIRRL